MDADHSHDLSSRVKGFILLFYSVLFPELSTVLGAEDVIEIGCLSHVKELKKET